MKKSIKAIWIDDIDQEANIKALQLQLNQICDLIVVPIVTADKIYRFPESDNTDPEKIKKKLSDVLKGDHFDWVFTDYDLAEESYNGIDIVAFIHAIRPKVPIILYSSNLNQIVKKILGKQAKGASEDDILVTVETLINLPIKAFIGRNRYKDELYRHIKNELGYSMEQELIKMLRKHDDLIFNSCFPPFNGKTFGEIAEILETKSDVNINEWKLAIVEQIIAYLIQINE